MLRSSAGKPPPPRSSRRSARRSLALLVVPALLFAGACGSEDGDDGDNEAKSSAAKVEVTGKFGDKPKISSPGEGKAPEKLTVDAVIPGEGRKVQKGDFVRLDFAGQSIKDDQSLGGTWETAEQSGSKGPRRQFVTQLGQPSQELPEQVLNSVLGQKAGSRLKVYGTAQSMVGDQLNPQSGLTPQDGLVFVIDVVAAKKVDAKAAVEGEQSQPDSDLPQIEFDEKKGPIVTVPKGEKAPTDLEEHLLVKGDGPKIGPGQGVVAQYVGVKWEDGKSFDSSWERAGPAAFQIGTGSVVKGWDDGLTGKRVGDRVELVVPPKFGYGDNKEHELAKNTLVFVVDVVGIV